MYTKKTLVIMCGIGPTMLKSYFANETKTQIFEYDMNNKCSRSYVNTGDC